MKFTPYYGLSTKAPKIDQKAPKIDRVDQLCDFSLP
jgi:hypothetical protein